MKYRLVQELAADFDVAVACRLLGVSRSGYYGWLTRALSSRAVADSALTETIKQVHHDSRGACQMVCVRGGSPYGRKRTVGY